MSRLDRHVAAVQNKMALDRFIGALAWASVVYAAAIWIGIVVYKFFQVQPPHTKWWLIGGAIACGVFALIWAIVRRPTRHEAAVAIDERLALKEKFSTALFARPIGDDPFAQAAVKDAERTAENVSIHKRFPLQFPQQSLGTAGIALLVVLTMAFLPKMDLFGREEKRQAVAAQQRRVDDARKAVEKALAVVAEAPKAVADDETIKQAKKDLEFQLHNGLKDPEQARRSALRALSDLDNTLKQQIMNSQNIADAQSENKAFKSLTPPADEKGPVADAQRKIAKNDFSGALDDVTEAVKKFDKMSDEDKKKAADQMNNMAKQLAQMANNPQAQQQMQQQLQKAGMNQQQAQQAAQLMQQAAQGNQQAQQQLQKAAQQAMNNMNQQQRQAAQQMMQQMQAQANAQQQANQMAQAAQQMAQAMQQQAQQQQGQQGQKGQQGQQQQGGQQQGGQQQAAGQQMPGAQQMQQQLQAMQAMKADAQQMAAAQAAAAQAAQDAAAGMNGQQNGQNGANGQNNGNWQGQGQIQGNNQQNQKWNGQAGKAGPNQGGIGAGDRTYKAQAPYTAKPEMDPSQDQEGGKILASTLIKAQSEKGESHVGVTEVAKPPEQEATDEIEQERISRPAQQAVKEYFSAWQKDAEKK
jgi:hypothetical protein